MLISYSQPELAGCEPTRRERWLAALSPTTRRLVITDELVAARVGPGAGPREVPRNNANELDHRRFCAWLCLEWLGGPVDILGGESTGKSTLAAALGQALETLHVPEYGRALWEAKRGALVFDDMLAIAQHQVAMEDEAAGRANRYLFCDTSRRGIPYELLTGQAAERIARMTKRMTSV